MTPLPPEEDANDLQILILNVQMTLRTLSGLIGSLHM